MRTLFTIGWGLFMVTVAFALQVGCWLSGHKMPAWAERRLAQYL